MDFDGSLGAGYLGFSPWFCCWNDVQFRLKLSGWDLSAVNPVPLSNFLGYNARNGRVCMDINGSGGTCVKNFNADGKAGSPFTFVSLHSFLPCFLHFLKEPSYRLFTNQKHKWSRSLRRKLRMIVISPLSLKAVYYKCIDLFHCTSLLCRTTRNEMYP